MGQMALTHTEHEVAASSTAPESADLREETVGLNISIRTGTGSGRTLLSAFDHALMGAGVADFNLVTLSSVIPTASRIRHVDGTLPGGHGDLLFCVRAEAFADQPGDTAWAGLGWVTDETGGGLFVEHHGHSEDSVIEQIEHSLGDMNRTRGGGYGEVQMTLASAQCADQPVCALVLAAYRVSSWHDGSEPQHRRGPHEDRLVASPPAASPTPASGPGGTHTAVIDEWISTDESQQQEIAAPVPVGGPVARVSLEKEVDYVTAKRYYQLYVQTFCDLDTLAAGRQLLHEEEFLAEMLDPRVHKFVAWDEEDVAIGMTTLTTDLETVPWVSPTYFAHHYPEHTARGAVYYLGFTLVHPDYRGAHVFHAMLQAMAQTVIDNQGIVGYDMCLANDEAGLGGSAGRLLSTMANITIEPIDRQNYYTMTFHGPSETPPSEDQQP
jgi:pyruvoyl-dependent arginine decarboxylase